VLCQHESRPRIVGSIKAGKKFKLFKKGGSTSLGLLVSKAILERWKCGKWLEGYNVSARRKAIIKLIIKKKNFLKKYGLCNARSNSFFVAESLANETRSARLSDGEDEGAGSVDEVCWEEAMEFESVKGSLQACWFRVTAGDVSELEASNWAK